MDTAIQDRQNLSLNRLGSLRSQTQYSDASFEKRSPKTTIRLSIKNPRTVQSNNSQIILNGIRNGNSLDENRNYLNSRNRNDRSPCSRSPCSSNRSSPNSREMKIAPILENDKETKDLKDKTEPNGAYKNNDENLSDKRGNDYSTTASAKDCKQVSVDKETEFPKLEKLIQVEIKKVENKNVAKKLIRCKTAIEIDDYSPKNNSKLVHNHKLIFSESVG